MGYVRRWSETPILFLFTQFNFIYLSFCIFALNLQSFIIISLYFLYIIDAIYKVYIATKISKNEISEELQIMLKSNIKIDLKMRILFSLSLATIFYLGL